MYVEGAPVPSVAVPLRERLTRVWPPTQPAVVEPMQVNSRGDPEKTTQELPAVNAAQLVFVYVVIAFRLNIRLGSLEKVRKLASPILAAVIGLFTSTASRVVSAGFIPPVLENVRLLPEATSESHRADGHEKTVPPVAAESTLNVIELIVAVTFPLEPVNSVPDTAAEATDIDTKSAQLAAPMTNRLRKIFTFVFLQLFIRYVVRDHFFHVHSAILS